MDRIRERDCRISCDIKPRLRLVIIPGPVFFSRDKHSEAGIRKRDRLTIKAMISKAQEFGKSSISSAQRGSPIPCSDRSDFEGRSFQAHRIPLLLAGAEKARRSSTHLSRAVQKSFPIALPDRSAGTAPHFSGKQINHSHIDTPEKTRTGRIPQYPRPARVFFLWRYD